MTALAPRTLAGEFIEAILAGLAEAEAHSWPSPRWRHDPVGFAREVLGVEPWEKQIEVLEVARDHKRVAVRSGHKVSKSHTAAILALWFYASFPEARVVMTCVTARQVDEILWREAKKLHARSGKCLACVNADDPRMPSPRPCPHSFVLDGVPRELARTGLHEGLRQVTGFTAREVEGVAGISGANLLYLCDEASGIGDGIFEAIEGNRAGGARIVLFSNPTKTDGEFFEAFNTKAGFYRTVHISSEDSPNVREGREVIPGLATREWVEEKRAEWGEDSPLYKVRVRGEFVKNEEGRIVSLHLLEESEARWSETPAEGRLFIGIDPAGPGGEGDESAFSVRRGHKQLALIAMRGLTGGAHVAHLLGLIIDHRKKREQPPVVVFDALGKAGADLHGALTNYLDGHPDAFELVPVRGSDKAIREPQVYDHVRDELWVNLAAWMKAGGAVLSDTKLAKELHAPELDGRSGRLRVTRKEDLRKILGRSPDRADATALSVWEPSFLRATADDFRPSRSSERDAAYDAANDDSISPYDTSGISPYD